MANWNRTKGITFFTRSFVAISALLAGLFSILWMLGPFYVTGGRVHFPGASETIHIQANAGMMHVTFNHDIPPGRKWFFHGFTSYPTSQRDRHLKQYNSHEVPESQDYKSAFGGTTFVLEMYGRQYRYTRYWFPVVVPAFIFSIVPCIAFLRWRLDHSKRGESHSEKERSAKTKV